MVRPTRFEIAERTQEGAPVLAVAGELDLSTAVELAQRVQDVLAAAPTSLTVDLSEVTFMDSSGLRLLIELHQRAGAEAWTLELVPPTHEPARAILRLTGADTALPFEDPPVG